MRALIALFALMCLASPAFGGPISSYPVVQPTGPELTLGTQSGVTVNMTAQSIANLAATSGAALPHAFNNSALSALAHTAYPVVVRDGFAVAGDSPTLVYTPNNAACSLNAGAGDGGSQVPTSDGKCWLASFPSLLDIRFWGAKADGTSSITPAFNAAMAYCVAQRNFVIGGSEAPGCTVYIPAGYFTVAATLHLAPNVSIRADPGALIQLAAGVPSATALLDGQYVAGCSTAFDCAMNDQWIEGGTWDCNSVTNAVGFYFPFIQRHFHVHNWHMRNCINGGGYVLIGNAGVIVQNNGLWMDGFVFENSTSGPTTATSNYGISLTGTGLLDSYFTNGMIEDTASPITVNESFNLHFTNVHVWNATVCMNEGFHFVGTSNGQDFLDNDVIDGPLCNATSAYGFDHGGPYIVHALRYDAGAMPGLPGTGTYAMFVGSGVTGTNTGMQLNGSGGVVILGDYSNTTVATWTTIGEVVANTTSSLAACSALPSVGACNIK
jgi:hypothetical protein